MLTWRVYNGVCTETLNLFATYAVVRIIFYLEFDIDVAKVVHDII
jgi:hypothetical protein